MKFPVSWLKEYLDTTASVQEISDKLTMLGLEVEGVEDPAKTLAGFVVGHVVACEKHPDADKLNVATVDIGTEKCQVVCGAPNCRTGLKGVFAPPKSFIPGLNITLGKAKIRGVESCGMLCSERELLISDEHNGIIELPESATPGTPAAQALGLNDPVIEISLTPNRGDCAGIYGIARELAASGLGTLRPLNIAPIKGAFKSPISITIADELACPLFIGRMVKNVRNETAPNRLHAHMKAAGLKVHSALVDVTNYLTIGLNRPLHVFDADKLTGNIHVRLSKKDESFTALDGEVYKLDQDLIVVCDDSGVIALAGVMGGLSTAVDENTKNVFIECAVFDAQSVSKAGRALMIDSDARYRFERGIDAGFTAKGIEAATALILELCGGEASETVVAGKNPSAHPAIAYQPERATMIGGFEISAESQLALFKALGFEVDTQNKAWAVTPPLWRHDINLPIDVAGMIVRMKGLEAVPVEPMRREAGCQPLFANGAEREFTVRRLLAARGLHECCTWSFTDEKTADLFGANETGFKDQLTLSNPLSVDLAIMRPSLLAGLLPAAVRNEARGFPNAALFEVARVYQSPNAEGQIKCCAGVRTGEAQLKHWAHPARPVDAFDAKADVMAVLEMAGLNPASIQITTDAPGYYHPGRSGVYRLGANVIAYFGELHPATLAEMKIDFPVVAFEVFLDRLPQSKNKNTSQKPMLALSAFQPVSRDFAFIVADDVEADKVIRAVKAADKNLITQVRLFDVYAGKGVDDGKKSLALTVTLQPMEKTLTEAEINALSQKVVETVNRQTGGVLRA